MRCSISFAGASCFWHPLHFSIGGGTSVMWPNHALQRTRRERRGCSQRALPLSHSLGECGWPPSRLGRVASMRVVGTRFVPFLLFLCLSLLTGCERKQSRV